jgi:hypothetical protein
VVAVARHDAPVDLAPEALARMAESRAVIEGSPTTRPALRGLDRVRALATTTFRSSSGSSCSAR